MHPQPLLKFTRLFRILVLLTNISYLLKPSPAGATDETECEPCSCGNVNISYPFWLSSEQPPDCGHPAFKVACKDNFTILVLPPPFDNSFSIRQIFYNNNSFLVTSTKFTNDCPIPPHHDVQFPLGDHFRNSSANGELVFYTCSTPPPSMEKTCADGIFACYGGNYSSPSPPTPPSRCEQLATVPVLRHDHEDKSISRDLATLLKDGFLVEWADVGNCAECTAPAGKCTSYYGAFPCMCPGGRPDDRNCTHTKEASHRKQIVTGLMVGVVVFLLVCAVLFLCMQKRFPNSINFWTKSEYIQNIEAFLNGCGSLAPKRYKYSDLKKMTKSFHEKLGQGGYGSVFKGTLQDGRLVAVKILSKSKENGAEFINEVAAIGRTSHVNIVTLLGFCLDGNKRALIYEFMPNGSLEKYIFSDKPKTILPWDKLYQIAIGIARGLEYLHSGCNTRIVHFDIKPHNILLDESYWPKISDFGLAKICPQKESILSMADARGTIGYIAPEVFCRNVGVVSTKSDVYSYGMMVLEMVGVRQNSKACTERTSDMYFPHWVYDHLDRGGDLRAYDVTAETEVIARKMILIGLWCIQTMPANRPSMSKAVELLEGRVSDIEMPPKPYLSSPLQSIINSSS